MHQYNWEKKLIYFVIYAATTNDGSTPTLFFFGKYNIYIKTKRDRIILFLKLTFHKKEKKNIHVLLYFCVFIFCICFVLFSFIAFYLK